MVKNKLELHYIMAIKKPPLVAQEWFVSFSYFVFFTFCSNHKQGLNLTVSCYLHFYHRQVPA